MKQLLHKTLSLLLSLLLVLGLAAPLAGCTAEDALDLLLVFCLHKKVYRQRLTYSTSR